MALVDYSSGSATSSDAESADAPPAKKLKTGSTITVEKLPPRANGAAKEKRPVSDLPPLPDTFHDLYASTVRNSVSDDPSLHQGRKRGTPHVVGNWPSHVYIEWHPSPQQHAMLVDLVSTIRRKLGDDHELHSFLTSDLNAPLPLHISLSRPLSLTTANKDAFLSAVSTSLRAFNPLTIPANGATHPAKGSSFALSPGGLAFYRSPDSDRTFLVLRVANAIVDGISSNPQLRELLRRCNSVAAAQGLPTLYAHSSKAYQAADAEDAVLIDNAFHISIAWTFRLPDEETCLASYRVFRSERFKELRRGKVDVNGVKVKIGNVVTHVGLAEGRSRHSAAGLGGSRATSSSSTEGDESPWA
ncbi:hypothetical protein B0T11DRAFT_64562 [Plectosphaerella cucumerina]|uniref:U6 snRNA phosphodiesterase n=1 Tax=Plectosphaerella cucumerina TaxID=40658 RepID=A0A8K0X642_9PEZI|nr:hypothetical protein B0T11DRAFT_64562 [Plectosphaerella cucumerina]